MPKMIRACEDASLWPELVFLYCHYDEWDNAALAMMERAADAWEHHCSKLHGPEPPQEAPEEMEEAPPPKTPDAIWTG
ncbi:hypothetical protein ASPFODRAFT_214718 [Aspergillus luchuensis CBS 106.47]|uniref:Uncharacterized protein n=1 Tax=Aspergillus luchuensis (strain CBS 106.47) TaxID=1137211 RepID=A0A1M3TUE0_ASPLC|nr:hypothetical protein ASPFODRAFT_214718 [Aspergillus luchuensis CBS 106.47]